jgi:hypothetical protein
LDEFAAEFADGLTVGLSGLVTARAILVLRRARAGASAGEQSRAHEKRHPLLHDASLGMGSAMWRQMKIPESVALFERTFGAAAPEG